MSVTLEQDKTYMAILRCGGKVGPVRYAAPNTWQIDAPFPDPIAWYRDGRVQLDRETPWDIVAVEEISEPKAYEGWNYLRQMRNYGVAQ